MNYNDSFKKAKYHPSDFKLTVDTDLDMIHYVQFYFRLPKLNNVTITNKQEKFKANILMNKSIQLPYYKYSKDDVEYIEVNKISLPVSEINKIRHIGNDLVEIYSFDLNFIYKKLVQTYKKEIRKLKLRKDNLLVMKENSLDIPYQTVNSPLADSMDVGEKENLENPDNIDWSKLLVMKQPNIFSRIIHSFTDDIYKYHDKKRIIMEDRINRYIEKSKITLTYLSWNTTHTDTLNFNPSKSIITFDKFYLENGCIYCEYEDFITKEKVTIVKLSNCNQWRKISSKNLFFDFENSVPIESVYKENSSDLKYHRTWECFIFNYHKLDDNSKNEINNKMDNLVLDSYNRKIEYINSQITILENDLTFYSKFN